MTQNPATLLAAQLELYQWLDQPKHCCKKRFVETDVYASYQQLATLHSNGKESTGTTEGWLPCRVHNIIVKRTRTQCRRDLDRHARGLLGYLR